MNTQFSAERRPIFFVKQVFVAVCLATFAQSTAGAFQETFVPNNEPASAQVNAHRVISRFVNIDTIVTCTPESAEFQETAESTFKAADYKKAANAIEQAILSDPKNGRMLLFAAQVFIANNDYTTAATYLDQATQILPHEDWYFVIRNVNRFYDNHDFERHIKQVAEFSVNNPAALDAHLIHAFFSGISGQSSVAKKQLEQIQAVWPVSSFAQRLTKAFDAANPNASASQEN